jgi:hypothetical protein
MRLLTALLIGGCLTATGALAQSKAEVQQMLDDWAAAFNEDAGKVAMHYKSDATLFPPGNDMLQGRQNAAKPDEEIKIREPVASKIRHLSVPQIGSYVMSDASSPRSSQQSEGNLPQGIVGWKSSSGRLPRPSPPPLPRMSSSMPRCCRARSPALPMCGPSSERPGRCSMPSLSSTR